MNYRLLKRIISGFAWLTRSRTVALLTFTVASYVTLSMWPDTLKAWGGFVAFVLLLNLARGVPDMIVRSLELSVATCEQLNAGLIILIKILRRVAMEAKQWLSE